jgi:hypothetical protein
MTTYARQKHKDIELTTEKYQGSRPQPAENPLEYGKEGKNNSAQGGTMVDDGA